MATNTEGQNAGEKPSIPELTKLVEAQSIQDQPDGILEKSSQKPGKKSQQGKSKPEKKPQPGGQPNATKQQGKKKTEGAALIGIDVAKDVDFSDWYQQVLTKGEFLDYYDVSGCVSLRNSSDAISAKPSRWPVHPQTALLFHLGRNTNMVQQTNQKYRG